MRPPRILLVGVSLAIEALSFNGAHAQPSAAVRAARVADVATVANQATTQVLASGITRVERWSERLIRHSDRVWSERLRSSAGPAHEHHKVAASAGHKHFNYDVAARMIERDPQGALTLRFVDRERGVVVDVPAAEFGTVGFDGRWDAAAHLVPPSLISQMPVLATAAPAGSRWRVQHAAGWTHRVLWSQAQQVALKIESRRDDGRYSRTVRLEPTKPASAALPWQDVKNYQQRNYEDFLD
jgi:hypothetical protein